MRRIRVFSAVAVLGVVASLGLVPAGPASAAVPGDVVISEFMFDPLSGVDGDEFLELTNRTASAVDLSGWSFTKGITLVFPAGATIGANARIVISPDAARTQATYGVSAAAVYTGGLSNSGETLTLADASLTVIDSVKYADRDPWPTTTDGTGPSLELIDPAADHNDPVNWAASTAARGNTAGAANSVAGTGLKPHITNMVATPNIPTVNQAVTVTATVTGNLNPPTLVFRYGANAADQTMAMTSTGVDTYTATVPGSTAGQLIRYRVEATNASGTNRNPRVDDSWNYKGVVVANGITSAIPVLEWFIADTDYNEIYNDPTNDITGPAVLAYNGQVFDNIHVNIRGQGSQDTPKPNWKIEMPRDHDIQINGLVEPVDEFAMQAEWSDTSHGGREILSWDAFQRAGVINTQMFPVRTQRNAAFQGMYTYVDLFDGTWRDREGYGDDQFFKANINAFDPTVPLVERRFEKKNPDDADFTPLQSFLDGIALTGTAQRNYMLANTNIPQMINYATVAAVLDHVDSTTKNFYMDRDSVTGRWDILPWDLDHTLGNHCCFINSNFVTPAEPGDRINNVMAAIFGVPEWRDMYFRRLRTVVNDALATGRMEALYDARVGPAQPEITMDFAKWPYKSTQTYANQRTSLFSAIQGRRNVFAGDARVPGNQPASPNIVINEIQPALAGSSTDFVELSNPSTTTAIDVSGWTITGGINLTIQPGAVILPGSTMTFVADDPTFRATYGSTAFVGGVYTGDLPASATLTLIRPDASVADTVTYGGAGWPDTSTGASLELTNPALDNSLPTSWAASTRPFGSPSAANGGPAAGNAPGAPTIGTTTAGNLSATIRWTAPANTGGSAISGYKVQVLDATNTQVGVLRNASPNATSLVVTDLAKGAPVHFLVSAINNAGPGPSSAASGAVTPPVTNTPGPPTIGNPTQGAAGGTLTATATWTPPTNTGGSAITNYVVTALRMSSTAADATVLSSTESARLGASVRSRAFTLIAGNYRFIVQAINIAGTGATSNRSNNIVPR